MKPEFIARWASWQTQNPKPKPNDGAQWFTGYAYLSDADVWFAWENMPEIPLDLRYTDFVRRLEEKLK